MDKKIVYKKNDLLGDRFFHSDAMRDIEQKDEKKQILNQYQEKKQLFNELKKYRDDGITEKELKGVLASLKYGTNDHFTQQEINALANELGVGHIEKKHLPSTSLSHTSQIDRAHHAANYGSHSDRMGGGRQLPVDDLVRNDMLHFLKKTLKERKQSHVVSGDMIFDKDEENVSYIDTQTGKRFFAHSSQLRRPQLNLRNQSSLRGRGLVGGGKNL